MEKTREEKDEIKQAFQRAKHDIYSLYSEISSIKRSLAETSHEISKISEILLQITANLSKKQEKQGQTNPTDRQIKPTHPTQNPTHFTLFNKGNRLFSSGNEGVPTDRQTNQQTDNTHKTQPKHPIEDAAKILDSLDDLKREIRLKFKQLTDQEILVFSTIYQLEEDQGTVNYKSVSEKLGLTESSIRDYIGRLLKKGIPVEKKKINNKQIKLSISQNLKKIASLPTILQLRDT